MTVQQWLRFTCRAKAELIAGDQTTGLTGHGQEALASKTITYRKREGGMIGGDDICARFIGDL